MTFDPSKWNPRYLAYVRANGEADPEKMLEKDERRMHKFMIWISEHWREFAKVSRVACIWGISTPCVTGDTRATMCVPNGSCCSNPSPRTS